MIFMILTKNSFQSNSHRLVSFDNTSKFGLVFPNTAAGFSNAIHGVFQGIAAGSGISNFLRAFSMLCLHSSSSVSMKKIPRNCLALSSSGFVDSPLLLRFAFRCIRHVLPHIWPSHCRVSRLFVSSSVSPRTMYLRQVAFHSIK